MSNTITKDPNNWIITDSGGSPIASSGFNTCCVSYSSNNDTIIIRGPGGPLYGGVLSQLVGLTGTTAQQRIQSLYDDFLNSFFLYIYE